MRDTITIHFDDGAKITLYVPAFFNPDEVIVGNVRRVLRWISADPDGGADALDAIRAHMLDDATARAYMRTKSTRRRYRAIADMLGISDRIPEDVAAIMAA